MPRRVGKKPKFGIGDLVAHIASGERGVVELICTSCSRHTGAERNQCSASCKTKFTGGYFIELGFGRRVRANEKSLVLVDLTAQGEDLEPNAIDDDPLEPSPEGEGEP